MSDVLEIRKTAIGTACICGLAFCEKNHVVEKAPDLGPRLVDGDDDGSSFSCEIL